REHAEDTAIAVVGFASGHIFFAIDGAQDRRQTVQGEHDADDDAEDGAEEQAAGPVACVLRDVEAATAPGRAGHRGNGPPALPVLRPTAGSPSRSLRRRLCRPGWSLWC